MGWSNALNKSFFEIWREVVVVTAQIFFKCFGNNLFYAEVIEVVKRKGVKGNGNAAFTFFLFLGRLIF